MPKEKSGVSCTAMGRRRRDVCEGTGSIDLGKKVHECSANYRSAGSASFGKSGGIHERSEECRSGASFGKSGSKSNIRECSEEVAASDAKETRCKCCVEAAMRRSTLNPKPEETKAQRLAKAPNEHKFNAKGFEAAGDFYGPVAVTGRGGHCYVFQMRLQNFNFSVHYPTPDCTSATAAENSSKFCALVKAKSNTPVVCVLTDNAKQFVAGDFVSRNAKAMLHKTERHVSAEEM